MYICDYYVIVMLLLHCCMSMFVCIMYVCLYVCFYVCVVEVCYLQDEDPVAGGLLIVIDNIDIYESRVAYVRDPLSEHGPRHCH